MIGLHAEFIVFIEFDFQKPLFKKSYGSLARSTAS